MTNIIVSGDSFPVVEGIRQLLPLIPYETTQEILAVFIFEKTWLTEAELSDVIRYPADRILVFIPPELVNIMSLVALPSKIAVFPWKISLQHIVLRLNIFLNARPVRRLHATGDNMKPEKLSSREEKVISLCMRGVSVRSISEIINVHPKTVSSHKRSAMRKLGMTTNQALFQRGRILFMNDRSGVM
ncbi:transcriptional regulator RcsB [compost metagenome]|uniref:helix-turn-helix domain-containing protein n=1 Tax=Kluyvera intermedia TaxID=61648 RepID=UPI000FAFAD7F